MCECATGTSPRMKLGRSDRDRRLICSGWLSMTRDEHTDFSEVNTLCLGNREQRQLNTHTNNCTPRSLHTHNLTHHTHIPYTLIPVPHIHHMYTVKQQYTGT